MIYVQSNTTSTLPTSYSIILIYYYYYLNLQTFINVEIFIDHNRKTIEYFLSGSSFFFFPRLKHDLVLLCILLILSINLNHSVYSFDCSIKIKFKFYCITLFRCRIWLKFTPFNIYLHRLCCFIIDLIGYFLHSLYFIIIVHKYLYPSFFSSALCEIMLYNFKTVFMFMFMIQKSC